MAEDESRATEATFLPQYDAPTFWRLGRWGLAACAAVTLAFLIGTSDMGMRRIALAYSNSQSAPAAAAPLPRDNIEVVRLNETVRKLTIDRDRLVARLDALERNFSDLTGSIALSFTPPRPATLPPAQPESATAPLSIPPTTSATAPTIAPSSPPTSIASNVPANSSTANPQSPPVPFAIPDATTPDTPGITKVEFGVDLGGAPTVEGLRTLWNNAKTRHATLLESLRPIVVIRESTRPGSVELRLVVGPLPSAALAQRMCVVITATGAVCQPAVFDGQRLAMR